SLNSYACRRNLSIWSKRVCGWILSTSSLPASLRHFDFISSFISVTPSLSTALSGYIISLYLFPRLRLRFPACPWQGWCGGRSAFNGRSPAETDLVHHVLPEPFRGNRDRHALNGSTVGNLGKEQIPLPLNLQGIPPDAIQAIRPPCVPGGVRPVLNFVFLVHCPLFGQVKRFQAFLHIGVQFIQQIRPRCVELYATPEHRGINAMPLEDSVVECRTVSPRRINGHRRKLPICQMYIQQQVRHSFPRDNPLGHLLSTGNH